MNTVSDPIQNIAAVSDYEEGGGAVVHLKQSVMNTQLIALELIHIIHIKIKLWKMKDIK